jgi:hypothetical protein
MKHMTKSFLFLYLVVLVAASCVPMTAVPTATSTATKLIIPTTTTAPTSTSMPVPTATATLSQVEQIFTIPTRSSDFVDMPTPIATPEIESSSMKLRDFSEADYLNLIHEMNEYTYKNFPPFDGWWEEGNFIVSQETVALVIQEYLYRFPESANSDRLRWQLAFINSIMYDGLAGNQYGDEWMLRELGRRLNQEETSPDQLGVILDKYWFDVSYVQPMPNLFNDDTTGWLYQVVPQLWARNGVLQNESIAEGSMFFVVREHNKNDYELFLLNSAWNLSSGTSYVFDIIDHNGNEIPEVALYIGGHGGTTCIGNLLIYEWGRDQFAELTNNQLLLRDCAESFEYTELENRPAITFHGWFPGRTEQYVWNGEFYEFSNYLGATSLEIWRNSLGKPHFSYEKEAELLKEILTSGEAVDFSPTYADYLRYRLGIVYALESKQDEAVKELEDLITSPLDPARTVFTDMARKFLEIYEGDATVYEACFQSRLVYDKALDLSQDFDDAKYEETFGIPFDPFSLGFFMCDEEDAFELMAKSIPATVVDIPSELRKNGVRIDYSQRIDANLDGNVDEWFVMFDTYNQFLVFPNGSQYQAKILDTGIGDKGVNYSATKVSVKSWDHLPHTIMIVQSGSEFVLLEVDENYESSALIYDFGVKNFVEADHNSLPEVQLFFSKPSPDDYFPDHPFDGYRWSTSDEEFMNDLLEYYLFMLRDPQKAAELAEQLLPLLEEWKKIPDTELWRMPYDYYLAGLSYELSGDQEKAAQIYWQLWHDFPDSHYARLAEFKLEPASP